MQNTFASPGRRQNPAFTSKHLIFANYRATMPHTYAKLAYSWLSDSGSCDFATMSTTIPLSGMPFFIKGKRKQ